MKFTKLLIALVSFVFLVSAVSAINISVQGSPVIPSSASTTATSFQITFVLNNTGTTGTVDFSNSTLTSPSSSSISFSPASGTSISANTLQSFTATVNFPAGTGNVAGTILAVPSSSSNSNVSIAFSVPRVAPTTTNRTFCDNGRLGTNLSLDSLDINSDGDKDEEWKPLDKITVEVDVNNDGDSNLRDVIVELGIFDSSGNDVTNDFDFSNADEEKFDVGTINDGDSETAKFEFEVAGDIDEGDYIIVAKAYSKKAGESNLCTDSYAGNDEETISVEAESDEGKFITFREIKFSPTEATCGDSVTMTFDAVNIGQDDQDQTLISVTSNDLKIDESIEIRKNLNTGDKERISITFAVPSGLADRLYNINFNAEYDYRNGLYRESLDDEYRISYKVFGCSLSNSGSSGNAPVVIGATLASDAKAGEELVVKSTVTNTATTSGTFILDVKNLASWASLEDISDRIFTLSAGESKTVEITLLPNEDASGEQSFNIEVSQGDKKETRSVVVDLGSAPSGSFSSLAENKLAWIIGIVNVILIILIIVVAVKISRR